MPKTFFIGDTHFSHQNVIAYDNRPFSSYQEMDEELVRRWNSVVKQGDTVWFLGDFTLSHRVDVIERFARRLKGRKNIILGNHDKRPVKTYYDVGFERVYDHPVIIKDFFILSHKPMFITPEMPYYNIYAHVHNHSAYETKTNNTCCVSCCRWDYKPIRIPEFDNYTPDRN